MKKTIRDENLNSKKVLVRCDFNVPLQDGEIANDIRIVEALPTLKYLIENKAKVIIASHLGRPKGKPSPKYSLAPVKARLSELLGQDVKFISCDTVIDDAVKSMAQNLKDGEVMLLENVRFREEETDNAPEFAKELSELAEIFVQEAFGTSHRAHASTAGVAYYLPALSGFLIEKEVKFLGDALNNPNRPLVAILGGAKVGDKIPIIENLIDKADAILVGGGMAYTFFKGMGLEIGDSLLDEENIELTREMLRKSEKKGVNFYLPVDILVADAFSEDANTRVVDFDKIPSDMEGMDIGPKTIELYTKVLKDANTVVWNGPLGVFEMNKFSTGTKSIAAVVASLSGDTIIGGGDLAAAVDKFGFRENMTHISTGGGASLEFLQGSTLPGIAVIQDK